jgi:hypothetical protein
MSSIRPTLVQDYTTQPPTSTSPVVSTTPLTGTPTGTRDVDGVDTATPTGSGSTSPLGQPRVTAGTTYDPTLGATTLGDVSTIGRLVSSTPSDDLDALLAKLLIAFHGTDKDATETLLQAANDRLKAEQEQEANKAVQLAELMDAANSGGCMARQRTEDKLIEMGYSPDQAHTIAKQMTGKHTSPGQQAILALSAVENAPGSKKAGPVGTDPTLTEDPAAVQQKQQAQQADAEATLLLLALLLASRSRGMDAGLAATGTGTGTTGGTGTGTPPVAGTGTAQPPGMSIT